MGTEFDAEEGAVSAQPESVAVDVATSALFAGDSGQLNLETRRVLVLLLLGPALDAKRQTRLWPVLLRDETVLRSRLHDLFLDLVVDHEQQVAFTRQIALDDLDIPILLRRANLTFIESALLIFLRQRLTQADTQGERAVVAWAEMAEQLRVFEAISNTDHSRFEKQIDSAIEKAKKLNLIRSLSGGEKRFEVAPTLKLLFSAEEIEQLTQAYSAALQRKGGLQRAQAELESEEADEHDSAIEGTESDGDAA